MIADARLLLLLLLLMLLLLLLLLIVLIKSAGDIKVGSSAALFNLSALKPGVREGENGAAISVGAAAAADTAAVASLNEADNVDEKEGGATGVNGTAAAARREAGEKNRGVPAAAAAAAAAEDDDDSVSAAVAEDVKEFDVATADDLETRGLVCVRGGIAETVVALPLLPYDAPR
jgi:hypothetical protein